MSGRYAAPRRGGPWPVAAWLMIPVALGGLAVAILIGALSPVIVLDLLSLWPVAAGGLLLLIPAFFFRKSHPRLIAVPALVVLTWLLLGTAAHLSGWSALPSGSAGLTGPPVSTSLARLTVALPAGEVRVGPGGDEAFTVEPITTGGDVGAPQSVERVASGELQIVLEERSDDPWFRFGGWEVAVSTQPSWAFEVRGATVDLDLVSVQVRAVAVTADGTVRLGAGTGRVQLTGDLTVVLPSGAPARLEGTASVPADWTEVDGSPTAPAGGDGWTLVVGDGSAVTVRYP